MNRTVDVLVVGAGPAGMSAAIDLAAKGVRVAVVDDQTAPGGQIWRHLEAERSTVLRTALGPGFKRGLDTVSRFRNADVEYHPATQLWQIEHGWRAFLSKDGKAFSLECRVILLATGAQERPTPFPDWTLPGVMTVGAAQILMKASSQIPADPVWIAGSGPLPLLYASQLLAAGGRVAGFLDTRPKGSMRRAAMYLHGAAGELREVLTGLGWLAHLRAAGVPVYRGVTEIKAHGRERLERISFVDGKGRERKAPSTVLLVHEGIVPSMHATLAAGCTHEWNTARACFEPVLDKWGMAMVPDIFVAGDGARIAGASAAALSGRVAALGILVRLGLLDRSDAEKACAPIMHLIKRQLRFRAFLDAFFPPPASPAAIADDTIVCRCEEITAGTLRDTARLHRGGPNQLKAFTRCGMGPCQGRQCGQAAAHILADAWGLSAAELGFFRFRPPLRPVTLGELAALDGQDSAPQS